MMTVYKHTKISLLPASLTGYPTYAWGRSSALTAHSALNTALNAASPVTITPAGD